MEKENFINKVMAMPEEAITSYVNKEKIWPTPNWIEMKDNGYDEKALWLIKTIRDRLFLNPNWNTKNMKGRMGMIPREKRKIAIDYIRMMTSIKKHLMDAKKIEDVKNIRKKIKDELGIKSVGMILSADDNFLTKSVSEKGLDVVTVDYKDMVQLSKIDNTWMGAKENIPEMAKQIIKKEKSRNMYFPMPTKKRNPLIFKNFDISMSEEEFLDTFNFLDIDYGNSVTEKEKRIFINEIASCFLTLCECMDIEKSSIGLQGLKIAYGCKYAPNGGVSYDLKNRTLFFPKNNWEGNVAKVWGLAFDHWQTNQADFVDFYASGKTKRITKIHPELSVPSISPFLNLWRKLNTIIWLKNPEDGMEYDYHKDIHKKILNEIQKVNNEKDLFIKRNPRDYRKEEGRKYIDSVNEWNKKIKNIMDNNEENINKIECDIRKNGYTDYIKQSIILGQTSRHWYNNEEIFSRAFEAMVEDKMIEMNCYNTLLAYGTLEKDNQGFRANPYPTGEERVTINEYYSNLINSILPQYNSNITHFQDNEFPEEMLMPACFD